MKTTIDRRVFLKTSLRAGLSLSLTQRLGAATFFEEENPEANARAVIVLWMAGGPSQIDTWDPKPGRPTGGDFAAIESTVSGIRVSEHLPQLAREMKHLALIRSMTSREGNHQRARYLAHSGYPPQGPTAHPALGALVAKELVDREPELPPFVSINGPSLGPGILGVELAPFVIRDPTRPIENLSPPRSVDQARFQKRFDLLKSLEESFLETHPAPEASSHWAVVEKAAALMQSQSLDAFDLSKEKASLREEYGNTTFGQGCLMARRLVEKGVRYVEVELGSWDTHTNNTETTRNLMGVLDPAMATLVRDLDSRGLLSSTLVVWLGEFGRTPRINGRGGRDHYPKAWSAVVAGGGVQGGQVLGATDANGEEIRERPVQVPDLFASLCHALGIDPDGVNYTPLGRPIPFTDHGVVASELFG
jgi:hypothetical protein